MGSAQSIDARVCLFALDQIGKPVLVLDGQGRVLYENAAAHALFAEATDARGLVTRPVVAWAERHYKASTDGNDDLRIHVRTEHGRHLALHARMFERGVYVVSLDDVTDVRHLQDELVRARRTESLGYMTANVVHDVNNLLTPILCLSGVLSRDVSVGPSEVGFADEIEVLAQRTATLLRHLLTFVRRGPERSSMVSVGTVLNDMRPLLEILTGRNVQLSVRIEDGLGDVRVSSARLEQALLNLVSNACDAMPRGGSLAVHAFHAERGSADGAKRPSIALAVSDTGIGMSDETQSRVFDEAFTTKESGSGIGLSSVHRFVTDAGGTVELTSRVGEGTTVTLLLPRHETAPSARVADTVRPPPRATGHETILVVDEDDGVRRGTRAVLEASGYAVLDTPPSDAVRVARSIGGALHLLVADLNPRVVDGDALLADLRAIHPEVMVLRMSGGMREHNSTFPVLRKAFSANELLQRVRDVLDVTSDRPAS